MATRNTTGSGKTKKFFLSLPRNHLWWWGGEGIKNIFSKVDFGEEKKIFPVLLPKSCVKNRFLFSFRRERLKAESDHFEDHEVVRVEYLVFKKSPVASPLAKTETNKDSYFCLMRKTQLGGGTETIYLEVSHRILKTLQNETGERLIFPVFDYHYQEPVFGDRAFLSQALL